MDREARNKWQREWRRKNPDKVKAAAKRANKEQEFGNTNFLLSNMRNFSPINDIDVLFAGFLPSLKSLLLLTMTIRLG
jgi:hypothetical protein